MRSHAAPSSLRELISVATCPLSQESHCGDAALPPIKPQADWAAEPFGFWGGGQLPPRYSWNINLRVQKDRQPPISLRAEKQRWRYSLKGRRSSPTSSGQPVEARGGEETQTPLQPAAVHGAEENKSIKASGGGSGALLLTLPVMGGAKLQRGRHRVHLIQLGSQRGLPREQAAEEGGAEMGGEQARVTKTFNLSLLPPLNRPH